MNKLSNAASACTGNVATQIFSGNEANHPLLIEENYVSVESYHPSPPSCDVKNQSVHNIASVSDISPAHSAINMPPPLTDIADTSALFQSHYVNIDNSVKAVIFRRAMDSLPSFRILTILSQHHIGLLIKKGEAKQIIIERFKSHVCSDYCLITVREAMRNNMPLFSSLGTSDIKLARKQILSLRCLSTFAGSSPPQTSKQATSMNTESHINMDFLVSVKLESLHRYVLETIANPSITRTALNNLLTFHNYVPSRYKTKLDKIHILSTHNCSEYCFITYGDAMQANLPITFSYETVSLQSVRERVYETASRKRRLPISELSEIYPAIKRVHLDDSSAWPQLLDHQEKVSIISEFRNALSSSVLSYIECSFCGINEQSSFISSFATSELNIDLLKLSVAELQRRTLQNTIQVYKANTIINSNYQVCHSCRLCIRTNRFFKVPLYTYSNNCWIGDVPPELQDLSFLEQQCISRARTTACTIKIDHTPNSQYKASGNVCILSQEPGPLLTTLPPPINEVTDEIVVLLVASENTLITDILLSKSPLLVRRHRIHDALTWLQRNNPFFHNIDISTENLLHYYPIHDIPNSVSIHHIVSNSITESEGSSYVQYPNDSDPNTPHCNPTFTSTCISDPDNVSNTFRARKLKAIQKLKSGSDPLVVFPSGSNPLPTWNNPTLYTYLWPVLFPYGTGLFEDPLRKETNLGFRFISLKQHVCHLLYLKDSRFQTHLSFIFVMVNIIQRRQSSYESKLACKRSWFPQVSLALSKVSPESLASVEKKLKQSNYIQPENAGENAILDLIKYVNYISNDITGSISEIHCMREEIRSITRQVGMPHLFITINPADYHNPIYQILAGRQIDLNKFFHDMSPGSESIMRSKIISQNPVSGARGFKILIDNFVDILLGTKRNSGIGLFGRVESYYGVVESQHRGSLHCHFLIWLHNALAPDKVKEKLADDIWKSSLINWLEDIVSQDFPSGTHEYDSTSQPYTSTPVMCTLPPTDSSYCSQMWKQDLRNVLHVTGQIHKHQQTCYKHLPKMLSTYKDADKDCRFQLPRPTVDHSYFDDDGYIHLKCSNGYLNSYNPICVSCLRCNMDIKYIGSGTAALAMTEYVTNYIAKVSLDTATVFTALCGTINALNCNNTSHNEPIDSNEQSRLLLLKVCNSMIGKRELSGQQVASYLCNIPNRFTNHKFYRVFWTKILRFTCGNLFTNTSDIQGGDSALSTLNAVDENQCDGYIIITEERLNTSINMDTMSYGPVIDDMLYRPPELEQLSLWELQSKFYRTDIKVNTDSTLRSTLVFRFDVKHPAYTTHCLKRRPSDITPVLVGTSIPRRDREDSAEKYCAAMLTLFKPWGHSIDSLLKLDTQTWQEALHIFMLHIHPSLKQIMDNMQAIYECRDAAQDFSKQRKIRLTELNSQIIHSPLHDINYEEDPVWSFAMQTEYDDLSPDSSVYTLSDIPLSLSKREISTTENFLATSQVQSFYDTDQCLQFDLPLCFYTKEGSPNDEAVAKQLHLLLMKQKQDAVNKFHSDNINITASQAAILDSSGTGNIGSILSVPLPYITTLNMQYEIALNSLQRRYPHIVEYFSPIQQFCCILIEKYTLNAEQTAIFLAYTDHIILKKKTAFRLLISGPGGTGKSQIFEAIKEFHTYLNKHASLKICAPTGLAANNIGGSTIHSEVSLRAPKNLIYENTSAAQTLRTNLEQRFKNVCTLICDEIYFLGAKDMCKLSKHLNIACQLPDTGCIYGNLNVLFAGDPAQLPPPGATSLFNQKALKLYAQQDFNLLSQNDKDIAEGLVPWMQFEHCIVLNKIMRQTEPIFQNLLNRLRFGNCTSEDYAFLQQFIIQNRTTQQNNSRLGIRNWVLDRANASPLICYTNIIRDVHNYRMCKSYAKETRQEFIYYYSLDTMKGTKTILTNALAEAAWQTPIKDANDLAGRLPLIPGMPVFLTENVATELGLSNGSEGTLINVKYYVLQSKRYCICAEVDIPTYTNLDSDHIHRVTIIPITQTIDIIFRHQKTKYTIKRKQLPLLPGFAYTAHNSQGRLLNKACIDLASCPNTAAAYVMLSRIRTLDGISILRPFPRQKISSHIPEEVRNEIARLNTMHHSTMDYIKSSIPWYYKSFPS